jgi:F-type H+-transporting ATPase subunit c
MNKIKKFKYVAYSVLALALLSMTAFAQGAADNESTVNAARAIGAGVGFGIAAGFAGIGQGLVGRGATEGVARNPGAASTVQTIMIIALALIESLVLFALLIAFVVVGSVK